MKNNMHPKILLSATVNNKRIRGRQCRIVIDPMVENINLIVIDRWMIHSKYM